MKKTLAVVVVMLLALTLCVSLVACGGGVAGTYKFESMTTKMGTVETTIKAGDEMEVAGIKIKYDADMMTLELKADGTAKFTSSMEDAPEAEEGKWEEKDGKVIVTYGENESVEFKLEDGKLVMERSEMGATVKITLAK